MARFLGKRFIMLLPIAQIATMLFTTSISAETGKKEYNSKGTITDESSINIDSSDIYTLDSAIEANNKTLENYAATAGDIYNNLSAVDNAVSKAKTDIAQALEDMNIYVSRNDAGAINSHAATTDWVGTTTAAKSAAVSNYTLEELIRQMKTSVTGTGSEMTAKINAGDFKSKKATSSVASGSQAVNLAGTTEINLDKNQQLVLPSGYYGNGMTINNVISGETLNWNPPYSASLIIDKPYTSGTISTSNAYNAGLNDGLSQGRNEGRNQAYNEIASRKNSYTDQSITSSMRSESSSSPFYMTFNNLSRIDAVVYCGGPAGDNYVTYDFRFSIPSYGNTLTVYDRGNGEHSTGNHYVTITARQYHALD